ncbi:hypothetical protein FEM48_Zijuj03G0130900 [Ziziphus jujuba var. spinosa]|uniref:Uncharacterized protein n=1 Tax=Ziziphus jujuba var. spinosa TaxID=714518 RepID=A0A978VQG8_ZIZJJ|nr:hypothetical protein FEM48_Zijuj03G0130900 [Ziziphus jujuba var. spinosa]
MEAFDADRESEGSVKRVSSFIHFHSYAQHSVVEPVAESLFHVTINLSDLPDLAVSHRPAVHYLQLLIPDSEKPPFLAIVSSPSLVASGGVLEFLVKSMVGCFAGSKRGDVVEVSKGLGNGLDKEQTDSYRPKDFTSLLRVIKLGTLFVVFMMHIGL